MKKRVLIFSTAYFPLVGGAEVAMKELTDRLPEFQFDLITARIQKGFASREQIGNVVVHRVGFGKPIDKYLLPVLGVCKAIRLVSKKQVHAVWSLMASYNGFAALVYTWLRPKTKVLLTLQEGDPIEHILKRVGPFRFLFIRIFKRANCIQAISRFLAQWAIDMGYQGKPEVVPNGVDIERFSQHISAEERERLRQQLNYQADDVVLVTTSRLTLKNGLRDVILALEELPSHVKFYIMGEGEELNALLTLTQEKGLQSRVCFAGRKSHDEIPRLLQACDIFIRPSLSEGLGNSFLEAMAVGLPIIGTPVGGIPDFLLDGQTGVFCQPNAPSSIAQAVKRLVEDSDLRQRIVVQGEQLVKQKYDWNIIARRMGDILNAL